MENNKIEKSKMIIDYCDYNWNNKILCCYLQRNIGRFGTFEDLQEMCNSYNITAYTTYMPPSEIMNNLDIEIIKKYECFGEEALILSSIERVKPLKNPYEERKLHEERFEKNIK